MKKNWEKKDDKKDLNLILVWRDKTETGKIPKVDEWSKDRRMNPKRRKPK